jgi:hypothetical protein
VTYQVWWLLDDGSQGAETVTTPAEARELEAESSSRMLGAPGKGAGEVD